MKKVILVASLALAMAACNNHQQEIDRLQQQNDSLRAVSQLKDDNMQLLATTMADVQANINAIKEREKIISVAVSENQNPASLIKSDIDAINDLLQENKKKVANLQAQLTKSNKKNKELESLINVMQAQIDQQNTEIENLKSMLEEKNIEIGFLNTAIIKLSTSVDSLAMEKANTDKELAAATDEIQTAYYIVASKKDLQNKGVITSAGLFAKKVSGDYDNSVFTKVNTTEFERLPLNVKKEKNVTILSAHPSSSYGFETGSDDNVVLVIKDQRDFWSASKYLVIQVK
ncbi:MAG: hypothetical protein J6Y82_11195 [Bacteroidales bacterium]|nr:hypothetical protein [Bacteroidales bacterium]